MISSTRRFIASESAGGVVLALATTGIALALGLVLGKAVGVLCGIGSALLLRGGRRRVP